jgi:hypothetical protein
MNAQYAMYPVKDFLSNFRILEVSNPLQLKNLSGIIAECGIVLDVNKCITIC